MRYKGHMHIIKTAHFKLQFRQNVKALLTLEMLGYG